MSMGRGPRMNSDNDARRRTESILAADHLAAAAKALDAPAPPGAVVFWDFKADAWAIRCDACGIAPRALLTLSGTEPQSQRDDHNNKAYLDERRDDHNARKHPKEERKP